MGRSEGLGGFLSLTPKGGAVGVGFCLLLVSSFPITPSSEELGAEVGQGLPVVVEEELMECPRTRCIGGRGDQGEESWDFLG